MNIFPDEIYLLYGIIHSDSLPRYLLASKILDINVVVLVNLDYFWQNHLFNELFDCSTPPFSVSLCSLLVVILSNSFKKDNEVTIIL